MILKETLSQTNNNFQAGDVDWAETYCYNERNQLTERRNREGVSRYLYDPEGNLLREKNGEKESVYRYDLLNRQTYLRTMEGREQENRYDGEGLRAGTVENGKAYTFLYHNGELLVESDGEGAAISRHVRGHGLSHIQTLGDSRYHACHRDEQGSTAYLTGEDGSVENSYLYDAFGNGLESLEGIQNRIKYTGQQYDPETGQYYLRARYYNPLIGRFTQEDTYRGDGLNLYAYCGNNPVIYYDPSGHEDIFLQNGSRINWGKEHGHNNPTHNNSIEAELDWASSLGATNIAKNNAQRDINGNRVYYTDPETGKTRFIKPDASYDIDGTRFNTNYVSNSKSASEMEREIAAFNHMAETDPNAVNTLKIEYDDPLASKPDKKKDEKKEKGKNCK